MVDENTTTSILDETHTIPLRVIRSHRAPKVRRSRIARVIGVSIAATIALGTIVSPVANTGDPGVTVAEAATTVQIPEVRGSQVDRSQRVVRASLTRKQRIERVISYALAQRGDRYVWGASGPNRWDCSGLVSVAFKKGAGKSLPHFTGGIQKKGIKVSKKNLKRGDIVFPQRGHVGIYLGNGKMVHASSGKGRVVVATVYGFYTARRVL